MAPTASPSVLNIARQYVAGGLSVIPIRRDGTKAPDGDVLPRIPHPDRDDKTIHSWKPFQERLPTDDELQRWFGRGACGIAIVAGVVSGGAECIDIDDEETGKQFRDELEADAPELLDLVTWIDTPSGGAHLWYRCEEISGNVNLAWPATPGPNGKWKALIQTRGEGGYALAPGSPADCHPLKKEYRRASGPFLTKMSDITLPQRELLFRLAKSFNQRPPDTKPVAQARHQTNGSASALSPADDYDRRGPSFQELLAGTGAEFSSDEPDHGKVRRPDKEKGWSATIGYCRGSHKEPLMRVFTSSWSPFESDHCYGKYHVYRLLKHGGDGAKAMAQLRKDGFGDKDWKPTPQNQPQPPQVQTSTPPQEADGKAEPEPWEEPIPLDDGVVCVPPFPLEVYPESLQEYIRHVSEAIVTPLDFAGCSVLAVAAGAIGASFRVNIKPGHTQSSSLFMGIVGDSSSRKSAVLELVMAPMQHEQARRLEDKDGDEILVQDPTTEMLIAMLAKYKRGLLYHRDELSGWITGFNQYKTAGGNDRQVYLSLWNGKYSSTHRKNQEQGPSWVAHPAVTIVGGLTPEKLESFEPTGDGFAERLLFTFPTTLKARGDDGYVIPHRSLDYWRDTVSRLYTYEMEQSERGKLMPTLLRFTRDGQDVWRKYSWMLADRINDPECHPAMKAVYGKLEAYVARISLTLHLLSAVDIDPHRSQIEAETVEAAGQLVVYFAGHYLKMIGTLGTDPRVSAAKKVLAWIMRQQHGETFTLRDLHRALCKTFRMQDSLVQPLHVLEQHRFIRYADQTYAGRGRRPSPLFEINPLLPRGS